MARRAGLAQPVIVAIGLVAAAVAFAVVTALLDQAEGTTDLRFSQIEADLEAAAAERAAFAEALALAEQELGRLRDDLSQVANRAPVVVASTPPIDFGLGLDIGEGEGQATEDPTEIVVIGEERYNIGITQPRNSVMLEVLGRPGDGLSQDCGRATNPRLLGLLETREIAPMRPVTMIRPALDSLQRIMDRLAADEPDLFAQMNNAGALCVRLIRGSATGISNHSWGTAIDLTMAGELDPFADGGTQFALAILADYFNDEGWYWGAGFGREDSMHFEVGVETLRAWAAAGLL